MYSFQWSTKLDPGNNITPPVIITAGATGGGGGPVKLAVAATAELPIVKLHVAPVHTPLQAENVNPAFGVSESVTGVPLVKLAEQVPGQLIPAGELVTDPPPTGVIVTVTLFVAGGANVAVTETGDDTIRTVHAPEPEQSPPQLTKLNPNVGVSDNEMDVPALNVPEHAGGQEIPAGLEVTVPSPLGVIVTVNVWGGGGGVGLP